MALPARIKPEPMGREKRIRSPAPLPCKLCGKAMTIRSWERPFEHAKRLYCSRACSSLSRAVPPEDRISRYVTINDAGCWEWTLYRDRKGYGRASTPPGLIGCTEVLAHRVSWILHRGPIPNGMHVLHHCDNPPCCNPDHLYIGTNDENMRDRIARGRCSSLPGEANPKARLSEAQVLLIREDNRTHSAIAASFGVTQATVSCIKRGVTWRHLIKGAAP